MTNPTVNRAYDMPASTDLVTNLPADFAIFGDAVDLDISSRGGYATTATAAGTTVLTVTSNRNQRFTGVTTQTVTMPVASTLAVGARFIIQNKSTGIVTVQSSGANTIYAIPAGATAEFVCILASGTTAASWDYDWAGASVAPAGSALTLITRQSFSAVANTGTTFDGVFSSTYKNYLVILETLWAATSTDDLYLQLRYAGPTTQAATYLGASQQWTPAAAGALTGSNSAAQMILATNMGVTASPGSGQISFGLVGNSSQSAKFWGNYIDKDGNVYNFGGMQDTARTYTGFILSSAASNITGTISIYGLAAA